MKWKLVTKICKCGRGSTWRALPQSPNEFASKTHDLSWSEAVRMDNRPMLRGRRRAADPEKKKNDDTYTDRPDEDFDQLYSSEVRGMQEAIEES